jgi:hypothetical protein
VNPGTVGTAADWLLRFLLYTQPPLRLATAGAILCRRRARLVGVLADIVASLGVGCDVLEATDSAGFIGPKTGSQADPEQLLRASWLLALI